MPYMLSLSHLCKLRPQTSFQEILLVLYFVPRNDMTLSQQRDAKETQEAGNATGIRKYIYGRLTCHERISASHGRGHLNTDPKIPPKSSHLETVGPFSFLDYFLLLVFTVILKYWEINTD